MTKGPKGARRRRRPRRWLISPEGFRDLRLSCLLSRKACAAYLGVCERTVRHWDAGRCRVPWSAVRLLRLLRQGELGGLSARWDGFRLVGDRLVTPDGRAFTVDGLRLWWSTVEQARLWRDAYDARNPHSAVGAPGSMGRAEPADGGALDLELADGGAHDGAGDPLDTATAALPAEPALAVRSPRPR